VRNDAKKSDALQYHLDLWKYALPAPSDPRSKQVYNHWSVLCVLMGKNFYKNATLADSEMVPMHMWQRYGVENRAWKQPILGRLAQHNRLINHMHDQAVPGESLRKKDTGDESLFSDSEMLSTPAPIMAPPPGLRPAARGRIAVGSVKHSR
jgi:hypothetical protein